MRPLKGILISLIVGLSIGCAKANNNGANSVPYVTVPSGAYVPSGVGPGLAPGPNNQYGGSAPLTIVDLATMSQYTGRPMNNPQNITMNLNLQSTGTNTSGGTLTISYTDNGYPYQGYFTTGTGSDATKYNVWFTSGSQQAWHGFFEDFLGGVIVSIDQVVNTGDGSGPQDSVGGSIWFKNFGLTYAPHPPTYCWFVSIGPYDCQSWSDGAGGINTTAGITPNNGYIKLGTFTGLSLKAAFNK